MSPILLNNILVVVVALLGFILGRTVTLIRYIDTALLSLALILFLVFVMRFLESQLMATKDNAYSRGVRETLMRCNPSTISGYQSGSIKPSQAKPPMGEGISFE